MWMLSGNDPCSERFLRARLGSFHRNLGAQASNLGAPGASQAAALRYTVRYIDQHISVVISAESRSMCQLTYQPTLGRYVNWYISRASDDMSTDILVEGCTKYTWSLSPCPPKSFFRLNHVRKVWKIYSHSRFRSQANNSGIFWLKRWLALFMFFCSYGRPWLLCWVKQWREVKTNSY